MKRAWILGVTAIVVACSSDDGGTDGGSDASMPDVQTVDSGKKDSGAQDTGTQDTGTQDTGAQDSGTDSASDSGTQDAGPADSGVDAGFLLNGCTDNSFVDVSNGNQSTRTVDWDLNQNFPYCFTINKGQSFVWNTTVNLTFANHPLEPAGGDQNNPIMTTSSGTTVSFTFNGTGNYGFDCQFHPGTMRGVIRVK
jgi:plastocyanin